MDRVRVRDSAKAVPNFSKSGRTWAQPKLPRPYLIPLFSSAPARPIWLSDVGSAYHWTQGDTMSNHTYRVIEIVGTSPDGVDAAIQSGLTRAKQTMRNLDWFEVESVRGHLIDGAVAHYQVSMKVGFRLEDSS